MRLEPRRSGSAAGSSDLHFPSWAVEYGGSPSSPGIAFFKVFFTVLKFLSVHVDTIVVGTAVEGMGVEGGCDHRYFRV